MTFCASSHFLARWNLPQPFKCTARMICLDCVSNFSTSRYSASKTSLFVFNMHMYMNCDYSSTKVRKLHFPSDYCTSTWPFVSTRSLSILSDFVKVFSNRLLYSTLLQLTHSTFRGFKYGKVPALRSLLTALIGAACPSRECGSSAVFCYLTEYLDVQPMPGFSRAVATSFILNVYVCNSNHILHLWCFLFVNVWSRRFYIWNVKQLIFLLNSSTLDAHIVIQFNEQYFTGRKENAYTINNKCC